MFREMTDAPYKNIAVAATFSPRFHQVLAEARRVRERFGATLSFIYVGKCDAATTRKFAEALEELQLPADSVIHYEEGDPATAILGVAGKHKLELVIAGALEKAAVHRQFLGDVARRLVQRKSRALSSFSPRPSSSRSRCATSFSWRNIASTRNVPFAAPSISPSGKNANAFTPFAVTPLSIKRAPAVAARRHGRPRAPSTKKRSRSRISFSAAGATPVPIETRCIRGNTGFAVSDFIQSVECESARRALGDEAGRGSETPGFDRLDHGCDSVQSLGDSLGV